MAGVFLFARPVYQAAHGESFRLSEGPPAADAAGAAGWTWPTTPGWVPGALVGQHHDFNVSGVQAVEVGPAQLAAAHALLDASKLRVLDSLRFDLRGPYAILAAPMLDVTPPKQCLAVMLAGVANVRWQCPHDPRDSISRSPVLLVAIAPRAPKGARPLFVMGVARGDVTRIVVTTPDGGSETLYRRDGTWGNFEISRSTGRGAKAVVYTDRGLVQTINLNLKPGTSRVVG
jgi:hypothetical protein